jgi:hypothetical protein
MKNRQRGLIEQIETLFFIKEALLGAYGSLEMT